MEEPLYEITSMRQFARLTLSVPIPDDTTIMSFRHLLEKHQLAAGILETINNYLQDKGLSLRQGTIVDATIIHAPSWTKKKEGKRDPEMHQTKKGNQYYFGMKAHISADAESGLVHHVHGTAANVADVTEVAQLLHGEENVGCADAGYTGVEKRPEPEGRQVIWQVAARRSTYKHLSKRSVLYKARRRIEKVKAQVRAKVEHPYPCDQVPIRLCEKPPPCLGQEHGATDHAICPVESVDGAPAIIACCGRGAPVRAENQGYALVFQ